MQKRKEKNEETCDFSQKFKDLWNYYFEVFDNQKNFKKQVDHGFFVLKKSKVINSNITRGKYYQKLYSIWQHYHLNLDLKSKYKSDSREWLLADRDLTHLICVMDVLVTNYHYMIDIKIAPQNITLA